MNEAYTIDQSGNPDRKTNEIFPAFDRIASTVAIEDENPTPCAMETFALLDAALAGGRFHCAHFSIIQHAVLNSFGYIARRLNAGPGQVDSKRDNINPIAHTQCTERGYR